MADYGDILLEAVQTVVDGSLSKLEFDKTVICQITDNSKANTGEYTVNDGSTTFIAYSDNSDYTIGTSVYVNIPNGDFTKQKMITGKYVTTKGDYYTYVAPWNNFVDITGDILPDDAPHSILANHDVTDDISDERLHEIELLKPYRIPDGKNYTSIGLKADFKTLLKNTGAESGTYGIRIYIRAVNKNGTKTGNPYKTYLAELSTLDMIGNPYAFESYYSQQKVFDVSGMGELYSIRVTLFQKNDFYDGNGQLIVKDLKDNIFVNNIYLALGYSIEDFDGDKTFLYSLDSETYGVDYGKYGKENTKTMKLRWIHKDENDNIRAYTDMTDIGDTARIHWYKYKLDQNVNDDLAGAFWEEIIEWRNTFEQSIDCFKFINYQDIQYKVIIETPVKELLLQDLENDSNIRILAHELQKAQANLESANLAYSLSANDENATELEKAQMNYESALGEYNDATEKYTANITLCESNIIKFTNDKKVADLETLDLIQALSLEVDPEGYKGIYTLYDETNQIQNAIESRKLRPITAIYKSTVTGDTDLDAAESIMWQIPLVNTMIQKPEVGVEFDDEANDEYMVSEDGTYCTITRNGKTVAGTIGKSFDHAAVQYFRIKNYFTPNATNNTINCFVTKNNKTYQASFDLTFGPLGTNGTDFTFLLKMESDRTCVYGLDHDPVEIIASLYDFNNTEVPHAQNEQITYQWYSEDNVQKIGFCSETGELYDANNQIITDEKWEALIDKWKKKEEYSIRLTPQYIPTVNEQDNHMHCYIRRLTDTEIALVNHFSIDRKLTTDDRIPYFYILEATITINATSETKAAGETLLNTYLTIPYASNYSLTQIAGADKIVYDTAGTTCQYYRDGYVLYSGDDKVEGVRWDEKNGASTIEERKYYPKVDDDGTLIPASTYVFDLSHQVAAVAYDPSEQEPLVLWTQPIVIYQNVYSSNLLNAWDGTYTVDEENGTIMSAMVGAGKKDEKNRFNGILMGDVQRHADTSADTGLFGYHEGVQSFGFKTDGTAFIGKAGKGQIQFDGDHGLIQSLSYSTNNTGMKIDLDDGVIEMQGNEVKTVQNKKTTDILSLTDFSQDLTNIKFLKNNQEIPITTTLNNAIKTLTDLNSKKVEEMSSAEILEAENALRIIRTGATDVIFNERNLSEYLIYLIGLYSQEIKDNNAKIGSNTAKIDAISASKLPVDIKTVKKLTKENEKLTQRNFTIQTTLDKISNSTNIFDDLVVCDEINKIRIEVFNLLLKKSQLENEKTNQTKSKEAIENQKESLNAKVDSLKQALQEAEQEMLKTYEGFSTETLRDYETYTKRKNQLEPEVESLQSSLNAIKYEIEDTEQRKKELENLLAKYESDFAENNKELQNNLSIARAEASALEQRIQPISNSEIELATTQSELAQTEQSLRNVIKEQEDKQAELNALPRVEKIVTNLDAVNENRQAFVRLQEQAAELDTYLNSLKERLNVLTAIANGREEFEEDKKTIEEYEAQILILDDDEEIAALQAKIRILQDKVNTYRTMLTQNGYSEENAALYVQENIDSLNMEIVMKQGELNEKNQEIRDFVFVEEQYNSTEYDENQLKIIAVEEQYNAITARVAELEEIIANLNIKISILKQNIITLKDLQNQLENKQREIAYLEELNNIAGNSQITETKAKISEITTSKLPDLRNNEKTISENLKTKSAELEEVKAKLVSLKMESVKAEEIDSFMQEVSQNNLKEKEIANLLLEVDSLSNQQRKIERDISDIEKTIIEHGLMISQRKNNILTRLNSLKFLDREKIKELVEKNNYGNNNFSSEYSTLLNEKYNLSFLLSSQLLNKTDVIPTYEGTKSKIRLATVSPYFKLTDTTAQDLMEISDSQYYLQTSGYTKAKNYTGEGGKGIKIDLQNGDLDGYNFTLRTMLSTEDTEDSMYVYNGSYVSLNSAGTDTNPFFRVHYNLWNSKDHSSEDNLKYNIDLLNITTTSFVLHSQNWNSIDEGMELDLTRGTLTAYSGFKFKATDPNNQHTFIEFNSSGNPFLKVSNDNHLLLDISLNSYLLRSFNWNDKKDNEDGIQLDLQNGKLTAYNNFILNAKISQGNYKGSYINLATSKDTLNFIVHYKYTDGENSALNQENDLLRITKNEFLLKSHNWNSTAEQGVQFDMSTGNITAYQFTIKAYRTDPSGKNAYGSAGKNQYVLVNSNQRFYPLQVKGDDDFYVTWTGEVYAPYIKADRAGQIGPFKFDKEAMYTTDNNKTLGGSGIYLGASGTTGFSVSDRFKVDGKGNLTAGGSALFKGELRTTGSTYINGDLHITGNIYGKNWGTAGGGIGGTGGTGGTSGGGYNGRNTGGTNVGFGNITAAGGKIAGWTIEEDALESNNGDIKLVPTNGYIKAGDVTITGSTGGRSQASSIRLGSGNYLFSYNGGLKIRGSSIEIGSGVGGIQGVSAGAVSIVDPVSFTYGIAKVYNSKPYTGKVTFTDGSYMHFNCGILISGKVVGGATFP